MVVKNKKAKLKRRNIKLLKSPYEGRPPTIFFQYPTVCNKIRNEGRLMDETEIEGVMPRTAYRLPALKTYSCVYKCF